MLRALAVGNYRSLRRLVVPLGRLIAALGSADGDTGPPQFLVLEKELGETRIANLDSQELPAWRWPAR
jgi:hypothetical protein